MAACLESNTYNPLKSVRAGYTRVAFIVTFCLISLILGCQRNHLGNLNGTLLDPSSEIGDFSFTSADKTLQISDFEAKYVILAFGYTYCPDACPTTMNRLAKTVQLLEERADQVQVILVSVDEQRDSPERLMSYTKAFDPSFEGVWVSKADSSHFFSTLGIYHERAGQSEERAPDTPLVNDEYLVDHTTSIVLLDRQGNWRMVWNFSLTAEEMASDLEKLIRHDAG